SPDFPADYPGNVGAPCTRKINFVNKPHSVSGTSPYIGDYIDATPIVPFVPDGLNAWKWATLASDVPYRAFRSIWTDNRNLVPPTYPSNLLEWQRYPTYAVPGTGGSMCNAGSRNADVLTSLVNAELVVAAPTTFKQLGTIQRAFPIFAQNATSQNRFFRFSFSNNPGNIASFDQFSAVDHIDDQLFAYSSETRVVYVQPGAPATATVKVRVQEIDGINV